MEDKTERSVMTSGSGHGSDPLSLSSNSSNSESDSRRKERRDALLRVVRILEYRLPATKRTTIMNDVCDVCDGCDV